MQFNTLSFTLSHITNVIASVLLFLCEMQMRIGPIGPEGGLMLFSNSQEC